MAPELTSVALTGVWPCTTSVLPKGRPGIHPNNLTAVCQGLCAMCPRTRNAAGDRAKVTAVTVTLAVPGAPPGEPLAISLANDLHGIHC